MVLAHECSHLEPSATLGDGLHVVEIPTALLFRSSRIVNYPPFVSLLYPGAERDDRVQRGDDLRRVRQRNEKDPGQDGR